MSVKMGAAVRVEISERCSSTHTVCILNVEDGRPSLSNESTNNVNMALDARERWGKRNYGSHITNMPTIFTWAAA
jgi:hypothetical protein